MFPTSQVRTNIKVSVYVCLIGQPSKCSAGICGYCYLTDCFQNKVKCMLICTWSSPLPTLSRFRRLSLLLLSSFLTSHLLIILTFYSLHQGVPHWTDHVSLYISASTRYNNVLIKYLEDNAHENDHLEIPTVDHKLNLDLDDVDWLILQITSRLEQTSDPFVSPKLLLSFSILWQTPPAPLWHFTINEWPHVSPLPLMIQDSC